MNANEKQRAIAACLATLATYVHATPESEDQFEAIAALLGDMNPRALGLAFHELFGTAKDPWLPSPGEIRELGMRLLREEQQSEQSLRAKDERDALGNRRQEHPEEFAGLADLVKLGRAHGLKLSVDENPKRSAPAEERQRDQAALQRIERQKRCMREWAGKELRAAVSPMGLTEFQAEFTFRTIGKTREEALEELRDMVRAAGLAKFV